MKNLLKNTLYLFAFAFAGIVFQISCSNSDSENQNNSFNSTPIGKIVYETDNKIWTANYDGSNATQIPIVLPANVSFNFGMLWSSLSVSPDGQTVFFTCFNTIHQYATTELYSCSINGGTATAVVTIPAGTSNTRHVGYAKAY